MDEDGSEFTPSEGYEKLEGQDQASAELLAHMRQMVNEPTFSDVVFVCNDGIQVHALRKFLSGRSDVLKSMLMNGMAESGLSEIELPEISSSLLLSVFEFLYTGTLFKYAPQSWTMSCAMVTASRFFILPKLEMIIIENFMYHQVSHDLTKAACQLTEAVGLKSYNWTMDYFLRYQVDLLSSDWSDSGYVGSLSEDAFTYLLAESSKQNLEGNDLDKFSFKEYLRFRQVIRWWIHQGGFEYSATEELLNLLVPDEKGALCLCRNADENVKSPPKDAASASKGAAGLLSDWNYFRVDLASKNSAIRIVSNIDCRQIHPILLQKVVEPLEIISPPEMQESFQFHALRRHMIFASDSPKCSWEHSESLSMDEQGHVIHKTQGNANIGLAVMKTKMSRRYGVYQWRFVVEEKNMNFCELGMYDRSQWRNRRLDRERLSRRLSFQTTARVLKYEWPREWTINWQEDSLKLRHLWNPFQVPITASFKYDASERTCSLSINGQDFGIVWENLSSGMCPAVSLGTSSLGRVRIEIVSGFDIL